MRPSTRELPEYPIIVLYHLIFYHSFLSLRPLTTNTARAAAEPLRFLPVCQARRLTSDLRPRSVYGVYLRLD
jgi:hypothetical protein